MVIAWTPLTDLVLFHTLTKIPIALHLVLILHLVVVLLLFAMFLGFTLSLQPQHGHNIPSQYTNNSHIAHLFCPAEYLPIEASDGLRALCRLHMPYRSTMNHIFFQQVAEQKNSKATIYSGLSFVSDEY
jgi:hypothetical protein